MYKLSIDRKIFDLSSPVAAGLISGLKKLSARDFVFFSEGLDFGDKSALEKILNLESISINRGNNENFVEEFVFKLNNKNNIVVLNEEINTFGEAVNLLLKKLRSSEEHRVTKETDIKIYVEIDGSGEAMVNTGIGFFDHMLEQIAKHANINLNVEVKGDLKVDEHHTVEDTGITLGSALSRALGDKKGIARYGFFLPMDDAAAKVAVDLGGRPYLNFKVKFEREKVGGFPTELTEEFFRGLAFGLKANIYVRSKAKNDHHKIEAIFKAFAKSLNEAFRMDERSENRLPSTKGVL